MLKAVNALTLAGCLARPAVHALNHGIHNPDTIDDPFPRFRGKASRPTNTKTGKRSFPQTGEQWSEPVKSP